MFATLCSQHQPLALKCALQLIEQWLDWKFSLLSFTTVSLIIEKSTGNRGLLSYSLISHENESPFCPSRLNFGRAVNVCEKTLPLSLDTLNYQYTRSSKPAFLTLFSEFMSPCPFFLLSTYLLFIPTAGLPRCPCKPVYQSSLCSPFYRHVPVDNHNPMIWVPFETSVLLCQLPLTKKCHCVFYLPPSLFWKFTPKYISSQLQSLYRDWVQRH